MDRGWRYDPLDSSKLAGLRIAYAVHTCSGFPWQLHAPGTASRQLLGTRRHFFPPGAAGRHVCLN